MRRWNLDVHIEQVTERLKAAGIGPDIGSIAYAGRASSGSGQVQVNISSVNPIRCSRALTALVPRI